MSPDSIATSVPVPIAMPMSAWRQRRGVVDAVADHRHALAGRLQRLDLVGLPLGAHLGEHAVDAEQPADRRAGAPVVAGDHHDRLAQPPQRVDRLAGVGLDGVGDGDEPRDLPVDADEDRGAPRLLERREPRLGRRDVEVQLGHQRAVAEDHLAPLDHRAHALAGDRLEVRGRRDRQAARRRPAHHGIRERVLGELLDARREAQQIRFADGAEHHHVGQFGRAAGQGAGLVEDDGRHGVRALQRLGALDQDAVLRPQAGADHDRRRRGQPERAGAGDDEHGDEDLEREGEPEAREEPEAEGEEGDRDDHRDEDGGDAVGERLDRRLRALGLLDEPDDLRERGVAADALGAEAEGAALVQRGAGHAVAGALLDRDALAGEHRLVHARVPLDHGAVDRHLLPGAHEHDVADRHLLDRNLDLDAVAHHDRGARRQAHQRADRLRGLAAGDRLEPLAQHDEGQQDPGGLVVELVGVIARAARPDEDRDDDAVEPGDAGAERDQGVHGRGAGFDDGEDAAGVELVIDGEDRRRQQELHERHRAVGERRQRQAQVGAHAEPEQRQAEAAPRAGTGSAARPFRAGAPPAPGRRSRPRGRPQSSTTGS